MEGGTWNGERQKGEKVKLSRAMGGDGNCFLIKKSIPINFAQEIPVGHQIR